jgi:hypothetical protein
VVPPIAAFLKMMTTHRSWRDVVASAGCGLVALALLAPRAPVTASSDMVLDRVYALAPAEGVFAYARIAPDGNSLAYASERSDPARLGYVTQTINVVDLSTRKVTFTEPGIDAYWSNDGGRMIFLSRKDGRESVSMRNTRTGAVTRDVADPRLGDYYSWGVRNGRDLILTIASNYYYLRGDRAEPSEHVAPCQGIGVGSRPLLAKDGMRITTFVRGLVVVRSLTDCSTIIHTGMQGGKADFSWDSRYIAFHTMKRDATGYEVVIVDLQDRTVRTIPSLPGSSLFPSWTRDGRLCFRYDGRDYRGFVIAANVLSLPARPLPIAPAPVPDVVSWEDLFPGTSRPLDAISVVVVWSTWSAHSTDALRSAERARQRLRADGISASFFSSLEISSLRSEASAMLRRDGIGLPSIDLSPARLRMTGAVNQIPAVLLFTGGVLRDTRLGAQPADALVQWVRDAGHRLSPSQSLRMHSNVIGMNFNFAMKE